jgi:GNAT superfamily N-acetyltransferase
MAASDHLSPTQFGEYTLEHSGPAHDGSHTIQAFHNDRPIGELRWAKGYGVHSVDVLPEHQRKGLATAMWNKAIELKKSNKNIPTIKHSTERTEDGNDWAKKVGRYYPPENIIHFEE